MLTKSLTGFWFDDQPAVKGGASPDGFAYAGKPRTPGFTAVRQAGEAVSVQLILEDGSVACGDCAAVQYSGVDGRDPLFLAEDFIPLMEERIVPLLTGLETERFRPPAERLDALAPDGKRLHTAVRYGVSQALLAAAAISRRLTMAEVIREEYGIEGDEYVPVPVFAQSGDDRFLNADKMIMKEADVLPHGLFNSLEKTGRRGERFLSYVEWLRDRVLRLRARPDYLPVFHLDVYGTLGLFTDGTVSGMLEYLLRCERAAAPFGIRIEGPVDAGSREETMRAEAALTAALRASGSKLEIVADEWCNTLEDIKLFADASAAHVIQIKTPDLGGVNNVAEAILYCRERGVGAYCGGTCNETDVSARVTANIAMACRALQCLAKPGMGVDEALMTVRNEMNRTAALANRRRAALREGR